MNKFTTQVRPIVLPELRNLIETSEIMPIENDCRYKTNIKKWLSPVIDLSEFYVYPINGITEGLNYWAGKETRNVTKINGDYEWVDSTVAGNDDIRYISIPSSVDGNFRELDYDGPIALDIAYVGTTAPNKIPITKNVEKVFYSLSKPFGLKNIRTGWYFTRRPDVKLYNLHIKSNYYNYFAHNVAELVIEHFTIDYVYDRMREIQLDVCNNMDLTPSDSVWLATSSDRVYDEFKRGNTNRLCITEFMRAHEAMSKLHP